MLVGYYPTYIVNIGSLGFTVSPDMSLDGISDLHGYGTLNADGRQREIGPTAGSPEYVAFIRPAITTWYELVLTDQS